MLGPVHLAVVTLSRLWAGWSRVQVLAGAACFSLLQNVQTGSGGHTLFSWVATRGCSLQGKVASVWGCL